MWKLSTDFYTAIGRVVAGTAQLDHNLAGIVVKLLNSDEAALIVAGQPFSWLNQAAKALSASLDDRQTAATLNDLLNQARELHQVRDLVAHGIWLPTREAVSLVFDDPNTLVGENIAVRPRRWKENLHGQILKIEDVQNLADQIDSLCGVTQKFLDDYI